MSGKDVEKEAGRGGTFKVEKSSQGLYKQEGSCSPLTGIGGIGDLIECVIASGAYLSFGRTQDGGSTLIRVLDGSEKLSTYCHSREELLAAIQALLVRYRKRGLNVVAPEV